MDEMQVFNYGEQEVRTLLIESSPWWVLVDVCRVLDLSNASQVAARLDEDEKMTLTLNEGHSGKRGGARKAVVVNESGLYSVILRSDKAEAKDFKRWITHEVLPTIRKTGGYMTPAAEAKMQPSVETGLQRAGLIIRAAEHKAVPQSEQLRLLDIAIRDLTGTGLNLSPAVCSPVGLMDLPETTGVLKKGKTKRSKGSIVEYLTLSEIADRAGISAADFAAFADAHNIKGGFNGEWVRVNTSFGEAREFLYAAWVLGTYREEVSKNAGKAVCPV